MAQIFTQSDVDYLRSIKIASDGKGDLIPVEAPPAPEVPYEVVAALGLPLGRTVQVSERMNTEPDPGPDDEKIVALILKKILSTPSCVPFAELATLGNAQAVKKAVMGLNHFGLIYFSEKKKGFYTNKAKADIINGLISRGVQ